jgi:hypothetical protein
MFVPMFADDRLNAALAQVLTVLLRTISRVSLNPLGPVAGTAAFPC